MTLRLLDLFSGIGGFSYAAERLVGGFETVQFVEREPFCQKVLRKHWPDVPISNDVRFFRPKPGSVDVVCGGFPCQDISRAGKRAGITGERSGLFFELVRIVREAQPRYVVLENVAAITGEGGGLDVVLRSLAEAGFDAEWACIKASDLGACHQRNRWWLVAYRAGWHAGTACTRCDGAERWGEACDMAGPAGSCESEAQERKRDGNAPLDCRSNDYGIPAWGFGAGNARGNAGNALQTTGPETSPHPLHQQREGSRASRQQESGMERREREPRWCCEGSRLSPDWRRYLSEPCLRRGDDGLRNRVDRLRALGNAVVPHVAAIPLKRVLELASE